MFILQLFSCYFSLKHIVQEFWALMNCHITKQLLTFNEVNIRIYQPSKIFGFGEYLFFGLIYPDVSFIKSRQLYNGTHTLRDFFYCVCFHVLKMLTIWMLLLFAQSHYSQSRCEKRSTSTGLFMHCPVCCKQYGFHRSKNILSLYLLSKKGVGKIINDGVGTWTRKSRARFQII